MNFIITGGTGFIGEHLKKYLVTKNHHIFIVTRTPEQHKNTENETYISYDIDTKDLPVIAGVINLAGESLFGYWTKEKKQKILSSRISATRQVIDLVKRLEHKPEVFISGSAVGFYGSSTEHIFTENTTASGEDFLSSVVAQWEDTASEAESLGIRTIYARFGIVLGKDGGSFPLMALPVKLLVGGKIGDGEQWISWIHIEDVVRLLDYCIYHKNISGPVNFTAPQPQRNKDFYRNLAKAAKRPYWFTTPALLLISILGEMGQLITEGQYVLPQKAADHDFRFRYPQLKLALKQLK